jgi:hypothetical protein
MVRTGKTLNETGIICDPKEPKDYRNLDHNIDTICG